jgi:hypothetical protein
VLDEVVEVDVAGAVDAGEPAAAPYPLRTPFGELFWAHALPPAISEAAKSAVTILVMGDSLLDLGWRIGGRGVVRQVCC